MHELSVTREIVNVLLQQAEESGAAKITGATLVVGQLSGIVAESVEMCFEVLTRDTIAAGARLTFRRVPARLRCHECGEEYEPGDELWICPKCEKYGGELLQGRKLEIESMEIES